MLCIHTHQTPIFDEFVPSVLPFFKTKDKKHKAIRLGHAYTVDRDGERRNKGTQAKD